MIVKLINRLIGDIVGGEIHTSAILEPLNQDPENPLSRAEIEGDNLTHYRNQVPV